MNAHEIEKYRNTLLLNEFGYDFCVETSISWVLLCEEHVFKIKKPVDLGFLDYSSLDKRKLMCENEMILNTRFSTDVYDSILTIRKKHDGNYSHQYGELIDYAVKMKRLDPRYLLSNMMAKPDLLPDTIIIKLAKTLARIHNQAPVISRQINIDQQFEKINLVMQLKDQMKNTALKEFYEIPRLCVQAARQYLHKFSNHFTNRKGAIRDCHGDMHSENIFTLPDNIQIIDCIEFKDEYRQIDVLDDFAATLTDLECYGHQSKADLLVEEYTRHIEVDVDPILVNYYKLQRAVTRFSVNVLSGNIEKSRIYVQKMAGYAKYLVKMMR